MATITKQEAVERVTHAIEKACPDDLVEIYNELFPEEPTTENEAKEGLTALVERIDAHIRNGLEMEEVLDLWNVIFPNHRRAWFDEDEALIHYNELKMIGCL